MNKDSKQNQIQNMRNIGYNEGYFDVQLEIFPKDSELFTAYIEGLKLGVKDGLKAKYENLLEYNMKREKYIHKMGYLSKINKHKLNYKKLSSTDKKIFRNGVSDAYNYLLNMTFKDFQDMKEGKQYQRTKNK